MGSSDMDPGALRWGDWQGRAAIERRDHPGSGGIANFRTPGRAAIPRVRRKVTFARVEDKAFQNNDLRQNSAAFCFREGAEKRIWKTSKT